MTFWILLPAISMAMLLLDLMMGRVERQSTVSFFLAWLFLVILSIPLFLAGEMGLDYQGYKYFYVSIPTVLSFLGGAELLPLGLEPGYQFIVMLAKSLGLGVRGPVVLLFFFSCYLLLKGCKIAELPPLTLSALFILLIYPDFYGQQRMAFAYACGVLILGYLGARKPFHILGVTLLATTVQYVSLAYAATLFVYFYDRKNLNYHQFLTRRLSIILGGLRKTFSADRISYAVPIGLVITLVLLTSSFSERIILFAIDILDSGFGRQIPMVDKFLQYYFRNSALELSFLGSIATALFIIILFATYTNTPNFWRVRFGLAFLVLSLLSFAFLASLPFVSYRLTQMFFLVGMMYTGAIIIFSNRGFYIAPVVFFLLLFIRYLNVVDSLGPYSF